MRQFLTKRCTTIVASFNNGHRSLGNASVQKSHFRPISGAVPNFHSLNLRLTANTRNSADHAEVYPTCPRQNRYFSGKGNDDRGVVVEVTKTKLKDFQQDQQESSSSTYSPPEAPPQRKKTVQQEAEEELYQLQSELKTHYQHANYKAALESSRNILEKSLELFDSQHPATASAYNNMGLMYKMLGSFEDSEENYLKALDIYRDVVGEDHASYAASLHNMGTLARTRAQMVTNNSNDDDNEAEAEVVETEGEENFDVERMKERMKYNQSAIEYFDKAYKVRYVELGPSHVHTVGSRSQLGTAMAAQVIWKQSLLLNAKKNPELEINDTDDAFQTDNVSDISWSIAEEHLRSALRTAVNNPRGKQIPTKTKQDKENQIPKKDKTKSKKEKRKDAKERKRMQRKLAGGSNNGMMGDASITTLSAAAAAQNLAIFLKTRASLVSEVGNAETGEESAVDTGDMYVEAKRLYLGALNVRNVLLSKFHPDTISTKFSLAELMEAIGDTESANKLREEIMDAYQVEEKEGRAENKSE